MNRKAKIDLCSSLRGRRSVGVMTAGLVLVLSASLSSPVQAQDPGVRYERKPKRTRTKMTLDTTFNKAKAEDDKRKGRHVDVMTASEFAIHHKAVSQELSDKQITILGRLLASTDKTDPDYPDFLFRLADHHLEKKAYFDQQVGVLYPLIYEARDKGNHKKAKQLEEKQLRFINEAKKSSLDAARIYKQLVDDPAFAAFQRMDEALYYYAFELGKLGKEASMKAAYQQLITNHVNSRFIAQAYLAFADYYYGENEIQNAVRLYEKVTQFKGSPVYAYALYKLAWCHLNPIGTAEARYDKSLNYFVETIKATLAGRAGSAANGKQLRRDARRDLVRAYVQVSKPSLAWSFFGKWGKGPKADEDDTRKMMKLLANHYFGEGKYVESTFVYKKLQDEFASDPDLCEWQSRIVVNTLAEDNKDVQWRETAALGAYWTQYKASKHKKSVKRKCRDGARDTMKQMATVWHDEADKTRLSQTYELAERAYQGYLGVFPGDKDSYELQYYYAELLWTMATRATNLKDKKSHKKGLEYFRRANAEFAAALKLNPKGKFTQEAAYAQMLAMKNALEYDEIGAKGVACKTNTEGVCIFDTGPSAQPTRDQDTRAKTSLEFPESDYTDDERSMLGAYDLYVKYVKDSKDKELPKIMYHRAKLMMEHNKFGEARPLLEEMVTDFDGTTYAAWCSEMLLDLLTIRWVDSSQSKKEQQASSRDLERWARKFQTLKSWSHAEADLLRETVPTLLMGIGWKDGEMHRQEGADYVAGKGGDPEGFRKCAESFIQVANNFGDHKRADTLLWNAAECLDAGYMVGESIKIRDLLLAEHPKSEHARDTLFYVASSHQRVARYRQAAQRFEQFASQHPKDERAPDALQNAYLYRLGVDDQEEAHADMDKYEAMFKRSDVKRAAKIFWSKHDLLRKDSERKAHAEAYLRTYGGRGGIDRQAVAEAVIGQILWRRSCEEALLFDSCLTLKRKKAISGLEAIAEQKRIDALRGRVEARKEKKKRKYRPPTHCGSDTRGVLTVNRRKKKQAAAAQKRFATVLKLAKKRPKIAAGDTQRAEAYRNAWGMAMVYQADEKYEAYLRVNMPDKLSFVVEEWKHGTGIAKLEREYQAQLVTTEKSIKRFTEFLENKKKLMVVLTGQYAGVKSSASPFWVLAGAARTALLSQNFADQLYRAEVPRDLKTEEEYFAYCDTLSDFAEPLQKRAQVAFTYCVDRSTQFQFFNEFSRLCEDEMQQQDAEAYPATNELFGTSIYTGSSIFPASVSRDLKGGHKVVARRKGGSTLGGAEE